jgi:biopolymer transport protein ExbB/TolQ
MELFFDIAHKSVYATEAVVVLAVAWFTLLIGTRVVQKRFRSRADADRFLEAAREELMQRNFDGVAKLCDSPRYWSKAVPQLILVTLENRKQKISKIKRLLADRFQFDVVADLERCLSWIGAAVKAGPMLGLLGTTICMINAFAKIGDSSQAGKAGTDPARLASDISFALGATCVGLFIAVPGILASNFLQVRIDKLQDEVQRDLNIFLEDFETAVAAPAGASEIRRPA